MNLIKDLLTEQELLRYNETLYPCNLSILRNALDIKLKENPDYEVFVPLIYYKCVNTTRTKFPHVFKPHGYYISNKGNIVSVRRKTLSILSECTGNHGYVKFSIPTGNKTQAKLLLHRAIACSFIPIPETLITKHPKNLQVNHKNGIKIDYELENLEWCTELENSQHASITGLTPKGMSHYAIKPVKGMVLYGDFKGHEFVLAGKTEMLNCGFDPVVVSRCCLGRAETHNNCKFMFADIRDVETLPKGLSEKIKVSIGSMNSHVKSFVLMTNLETNETTKVIGGKRELLELGFDESAVSKVIKGKLKTHRNHTFSRVYD